MGERIWSSARSAAGVGSVVVLAGAGYWIFQLPRFLQHAVSSSAIVLGLALVAALTWFILLLAGYQARENGDIDVPSSLAWLLVAILMTGLIGTMLYFLER